MPEPKSFDDLADILSDYFPVSRPFSVTYRDDDGDMVAISSDAELAELTRLVRDGALKMVFMTVHDSGSQTGDSRAASTPAQPTSSAPPNEPQQQQPQPQQQQRQPQNQQQTQQPRQAQQSQQQGAGPQYFQNPNFGFNMPPQSGSMPGPDLTPLMNGLAQVLASVGNTVNQATACGTAAASRAVNEAAAAAAAAASAAPPPPGPFGPGQFPGRPGRRGWGGGYGRRFGNRGMGRRGGWCNMGSCGADALAFAAAPLMAVFGPLAGMFTAEMHGTGAFSRINDVSPATREAWSSAYDAISSADVEMETVCNFARELFPSFATALSEALPESGTVSSEVIDGLVSRFDERVRAVFGDSAANAIAHLMRTALRDDPVVDMLRALPLTDMASAYEQANSREGGQEQSDPFRIHRRVQCDACDKIPIVGTRYRCSNRSNYDLCEECYNNDEVSKENMTFEACEYVWSAELRDEKVPPPPLTLGDRGPRVKFLQKVLTDLGFMNSSMYARRAGVFGRNTRNAVRQFQMEFSLDNSVESGVYDATTAASLLSVVETPGPQHRTGDDAGSSSENPPQDSSAQDASSQGSSAQDRPVQNSQPEQAAAQS